MTISHAASQQLALIAEVNRILDGDNIPHWLFGGWSVDFLAGRVTREHGDIEFLIWEHDSPRARDVMESAGYTIVDHPHPEEALIWKKDGVLVELYYIVETPDGHFDGRGRWQKWPYPLSGLVDDPRMLEGVRVPTVSLEVIFQTKREYQRHTGNALRSRDEVDLAVLDALEPGR
jgi:hypothetical protein